MSEFIELQRSLSAQNWPEAAHLYEQYPNSFHNAIRTIQKRGSDVFPQDTVIQDWQIYRGDVAYTPATHIHDGKLRAFNPKAHADPSDTECVSFRVNGTWAYIQVAQYILLDLIGDIPLPPQPTQEDVYALLGV